MAHSVNPAVSVVIPTYCHQDYVLETLDSVFAQTFTDYEVIIINDGSPDQTAEVLRSSVESKRIRYYEQTNAGQSAARNHGLAEARGKFIAFLDDDDLWPPDKLAWQVDVLKATDAVLIGGRTAQLRDGLIVPPQTDWRSDKLSLTDLAKGCSFLSPGQTLIRREALDKIGGFDESIWGVDDYDLYLRLAKHGELRVDSQVSLYYRLHAGNASRQREKMLLNGYKVVRQHFSADNRSMSRPAFRWLYMYAGRERIGHAKEAIRKCNWSSAMSDLRNLSIFVHPACRDFALAKEILFDLLPTRLRLTQ